MGPIFLEVEGGVVYVARKIVFMNETLYDVIVVVYSPDVHFL